MAQRLLEPIKWHTFAGGTSALRSNMYSYMAHVSAIDSTYLGEYHITPPTYRRHYYDVLFANRKGILRGGLWHTIGRSRMPHVAKAIARDHAEQIVRIMYGPTRGAGGVKL
jgi:hypothetical protein